MAYDPILKLRKALGEEYKMTVGLCVPDYFFPEKYDGECSYYGPEHAHILKTVVPTESYPEKITCTSVQSSRPLSDEELEVLKEKIQAFRQHQTVGGRGNYYQMIHSERKFESVERYYYETPEYVKLRDSFMNKYNEFAQNSEEALTQKDMNCIVYDHRNPPHGPYTVNRDVIYSVDDMITSRKKINELVRRMCTSNSLLNVEPFSRFKTTEPVTSENQYDLVPYMAAHLCGLLEMKPVYTPSDSFVNAHTSSGPTKFHDVFIEIYSIDIDKCFDELVSFINKNM